MEYSKSVGKQILEAIVSKYVDRGDPADFDFTLVDIIQDDAWHELDLSSIVPPAGASHLVHLIAGIKATKADNYLYFRKRGNANEVNIVCIRSQAANVGSDEDCLVLMDATRKIQYKAAIDNWTAIIIAVRGWAEG